MTSFPPTARDGAGRTTPGQMWLALVLIAAAAAYVIQERTILGLLPAYDLYAYFYPKVLYALDSLGDGGKGLLWNPYQNCGQPFFAVSQTGLLYPPYALFLILDPAWALRGVLFVHLVLGGVGAYLLGRELGAGRGAALVGALTFEMGGAMLQLTISSPTHCAPYAWLPMAMWCCERLLRVPALDRALALAAVLAVMLLPGMPQTVFFAYQLIALRVLWELVTRPLPSRGRLLAWVLFAMVLPVALAAVQLFPELEVARESIRSGSLTAREISPYRHTQLRALLAAIARRSVEQPFLLVPCLIGVATFFDARLRRRGSYYAIAGALAVTLAMGSGSPLYDLYSHLPGARLFRQPGRFLWIASFCLSPLTALGSESLAAAKRSLAWPRKAAALGALLVPLLLLRALTPDGFLPSEWLAALAVLLVAAIGLSRQRRAAWLPLLLLAALLLQLHQPRPFGTMFLYPTTAPNYGAHAELFDALRARVEPTSRLYLVAPHAWKNAFTFIDKTASVLRVPAVFDYEPLVAQRYAELQVRMLSGRSMLSRNDAIYSAPRLSPNLNRRLLNLTGARYLVVAPPYASDAERLDPPLRKIEIPGELAVFENPQAFPRAFFVPKVVVVSKPPQLLERLAAGDDDLRQVALLEREPPSGFAGAAGTGESAAVRWQRSDPEEIAIEVDAPSRGFLVLTDQYFPGWDATVNDRPASIQRADHAFRLVELPAGHSRVEFRYRPRSLLYGAVTSALAALAAAAALLRAARRRASSAR